MMKVFGRVLFATGVWLCFLCFVFNINGNILGLPSYITTARVGMIFSSLLFFFVIQKKLLIFKGMPSKSLVMPIIWIQVIVIIWGGFSYFLSDVVLTEKSVIYIISWILVCIVFMQSCVYFRLIDVEFFVVIWIWGSLFVLLLLWVSVFSKIGFSEANIYIVRFFIDERLPGGINRFMNGVFVLLIVPIGILFGAIKTDGALWLISLFVVIFGVVFGIITGSRQYVSGIVLFLFLLLISFYFVSGLSRKVFYLKSTMFIAGFVGMLYLFTKLFISIDFIDMFQIRFFETTLEQYSEGSARTDRYIEQLEIILQYPIFGLGPGGYFSIMGVYPDSGFIGLAVDYGLTLTIIFILLMMFIIMQLWLKRYNAASAYCSSVYMVIFSGIVVLFFWFNMFNELLKEYFFWMLFSMIIGVKYNMIETLKKSV